MGKKTSKKSSKKRLGSDSRISADELVRQGNVALSNVQLELAASLFERAMKLQPNDTNIMDALAEIYLQIGNQDMAYDLLTRSTTIAPEQNPYKWFYFAQLQDGFDSMACYEKGISFLLSNLDNSDTKV